MDADRDRLRRLLEPLHGPASRFARHLCKSRADGDDLYQEAVLRALRKLAALRDDAAFKPWLYRVIISVHRNRCRRAFWRRLVPLDGGTAEAAERAEADYRTEWSPGAARAAERARAALAALPAVQREAIALFEIEGWQVGELAALYGVSASAIKSRLARGRAAMRAHYEGAPPAIAADALEGESP